MSRSVTIYVLFHEGKFRDVFASFSEASRVAHSGGCCVIKSFVREDY